MKISARFDFWADCFFLILNNGKLLVTPNKVYAGPNRIDLTQDTKYVHPTAKQCNYVYTHPSTKQCNYSYTHPTSKQCNWEPSANNLLWKKLIDIDFTVNWSRGSNDDNGIGKTFSLGSYSSYPYLKIVLNSASIGTLYHYSYSGNTVRIAAGYSFRKWNGQMPYLNSQSFALSNSYTIAHNTTKTNVALAPLDEYKSTGTQQPWIKFADGKYGKMIDMGINPGDSGDPDYEAYEESTLHVFFSLSGTGLVEYTSGTNAHINATLYGSNFYLLAQ